MATFFQTSHYKWIDLKSLILSLGLSQVTIGHVDTVCKQHIIEEILPAQRHNHPEGRLFCVVET